MKQNREEKVIKYLRSLILRTMTVIVLFLIMAILSKSNKTYKDVIISNVYEKNLPFAKIKSLYQKYLGGIEPITKIMEETTPVFNEELTYESKDPYLDGTKLKVTPNYLVPILAEGLVVFIGEKENYGNVIVIESLDGIDIWYGYIKEPTVKLYDYVKKGAYLGATDDTYLFLAYQKDGQFLDYNQYLK